MDIERRMTGGRVELRARDDGAKRIGGYASVFYDGTPDTEYWIFDDLVERVMPGAYDTVLTRGDDVAALWDHDVGELLGRTASETLRLNQDSKGLAFEVDLPDTQIGRDTGTLVERGDVTGASIGFMVGGQADGGREVWRTENGVDIREIYSVGYLRDVSPVTFPAFTGTAVGLRALGDAGDIDAARREAVEARARKLAAVRGRAKAVAGLERICRS